jgi:hypothetical protein
LLTIFESRSYSQSLPNLDAEQLELAKIYAEANPFRSRPRGSDRLVDGAIVLSDHRVPRPMKAG